VRSTRNVAITTEGKTLSGLWPVECSPCERKHGIGSSPEMKGRVTIGVPDDYALSLLPQVLGKFAMAHPRIEIRVIGLPSSALAPLLKDNTLDLAYITKTRGIAGEFIRFEPMVWAGSPSRKVWKERPLPIAVFAHGSTARAYAISALQRENIKYRMSYESPSLLGLISMVEAGLAIAPLAKCSVPGHLVQLSQNEGLPPLANSKSSCSQRPIRPTALRFSRGTDSG